MERLSLLQAARAVGIDPRNARAMLPELTRALHDHNEIDSTRRSWSPGEVVAMTVMRTLDPHDVNPDRWAAGAARVGDAHERGLCPAYLVTAGGTAYAVVLDADGAESAAVELTCRMAAAGQAVRVVPLAPIVEHLCDVLEARRPA